MTYELSTYTQKMSIYQNISDLNKLYDMAGKVILGGI